MSPPSPTAAGPSDPGGGRPFSPFVRRHIGPDEEQTAVMLDALGAASLDALIEETVPAAIRYHGSFALGSGTSEPEALAELRAMAAENRVLRSCIGMGYHDCVVPPVILRNVLEDPSWYTAYTPYQAEIAQGRLEALLNFQTMITDLTGMEIANASLLDEATAAAEAMALCHHAAPGDRRRFFASERCHPQTLEVVSTRAWALGLDVVVGDPRAVELDDGFCGALVQYPCTLGLVDDCDDLVERAHAHGVLVVVAADPLALTLLRPPGEMGADIAVGSTQRFGVPLGFGGPHAAYMAARERLKRQIPGRVVGVSKDARGRVAYRLALQTREQHIRREKATSNICTAQVLPAVLASMYAVYHGPEGLVEIARRVHGLARSLAERVLACGHRLVGEHFFDTLAIDLEGVDADGALARARAAGFNLRRLGDARIGVTLDERSTEVEVSQLVEALTVTPVPAVQPSALTEWPSELHRTTAFLEHPVFRSYRSETEMLRYLHRLAAKDLSLTSSMIPLGSCTMKLNATAEMLPITWSQWADVHPFAPAEQAAGYHRLCGEIERMLATLTGFSAVSLQPNAGSQGELSGLLVIRRYHEARGESDRRVCLIPQSAHGTNPASAVMAGLEVVVVACDDDGNVDLDDLRARIEQHRERLAALMVTYPSTHGVFEESIGSICAAVHQAGGQVYMDGANFNAMVGLCRPADFGADVCHLNLHKTFCIPHGGGGPGMGPIAVAAHLAPHLPGHRVAGLGGPESVGAVSAAPWGSPLILPISWMYVRMMGGEGLRRASEIAILNANYVADRLAGHFPVLYRGAAGRVAHECILDLRGLKREAGVEVEDVAKRLMDYGFHAPTVSWPVAGTVMVEPTESESLAELDRFCDAMISIRRETEDIVNGVVALEQSPLRNAPHPAEDLLDEAWARPYSRAQAAYPTPWTRASKYWPPVARIDNVWGDRHLVCTCPPLDSYADAATTTD